MNAEALQYVTVSGADVYDQSRWIGRNADDGGGIHNEVMRTDERNDDTVLRTVAVNARLTVPQ